MQSTEEKKLNEMLVAKREKLQELKDAGKDPFQISKFDVTHHSIEIKDNFEELEEKKKYLLLDV